MANEQNLIPFDARTESEQREIRRKGGIASGKARRKKKALRERFEAIGSLNMPSGMRKKILSLSNGEDVDFDMMDAAIFGTYMAAVNGNSQAMAMIAQYTDAGADDMEEIDGLSRALFDELEGKGGE